MNPQKLKKIPLFLLILLFGVGFVLSLYYAVQSFSGIQEGILGWLKSLIYEQHKNYLWLFWQVVKVISLCASAFVLYILFLSGLGVVFSENIEGFKNAVIRKFHNYSRALRPVMIVNAIATLILAASIMFFDTIIAVSGVSLVAVTFISAFIGLNIVLFVAIATVFSLWQLVRLKLFVLLPN